MTVGEGEESLGVVRDDHHPLADRVFTVGGSIRGPQARRQALHKYEN